MDSSLKNKLRKIKKHRTNFVVDLIRGAAIKMEERSERTKQKLI